MCSLEGLDGFGDRRPILPDRGHQLSTVEYVLERLPSIMLGSKALPADAKFFDCAGTLVVKRSRPLALLYDSLDLMDGVI